jgi:2-polyprenyl-3-methyl-5-hydroxy-6-metoxy-1,4-benzoquinol methylase
MHQEIIGLSNYNLCGNSDFKFLFRGNIGDDVGSRFSQYAYYDDIYRCNNCRLVAQIQIHDGEAIKHFLQEEKYLDEAIGNLNLVEKHFQFNVLTKIIKNFTTLKNQKLLDVGANTGVFLASIKDKVKTAQGIEASEEATIAAQTIHKLDVQSGLIAEVDLPNDNFDIITMFDVIEHLTDPMNDLNILFQKLKLGGRIFITTHDIETLLARLSGRHNPMLMYQHFYHFSPNTLSRMLQANGYRIVSTKRFLKSWSFEYLYHLVEKIWPGTIFASTIQTVLHPFYRVQFIRKLRIVLPQRDFFMLIAEKPHSNNG